MPSIEEHYKNLLAPYYTWIQGGAEQQLSAFRDFFSRHGVEPNGGSIALDLGAGSGFQSIPLAELGYQVIAIDTSRELLDELRQCAGDLPITIIRDDLLGFAPHCPSQAALIVCMGDTITHLNTLRDVRHLIGNSQRKLLSKGRLFLDFRDMSAAAKGLERFVAVRSDAHRIFTCFLEYESRHVKIHDLVYERHETQWRLRKSYYRKLRISTDWLQSQIEKAGLAIEYLNVRNGMTTIIARRP